MSDSRSPDDPTDDKRRAELERMRYNAAFGACAPSILKRREQLVLDGYQFIGVGTIRPNELCGCSSGRKFKNCCASNVVRLAAATWFRPGATARTRRML